MVLEVKYDSASRPYSDSVAQWVEFRGQDEHEAAVGVTQYSFSAEQMLMSSTATITMSDALLAIVL